MRVRRVLLLILAALALTVILAACSLDFADLSNWLDMRIQNDTPRTVTVIAPGYGVRDSLAPGRAREEALWLNDHASVALVRVTSAGKTLGCLTVHYRKGQLHAKVRVSHATQRQCLVKPSQIG